MVLKYVRNTAWASGDPGDHPSGQDDGRQMTDFQREMILAEQHADNVRKRQRENLLSREQMPVVRPRNNMEIEEGMILEEHLEELAADEISPQPEDAPDSSRTTLFEDDADELDYADAGVVNKARVSKLRALHILEHPHCSKFLVGTVMRVLVSLDADPDSISSIYPTLINSHAILKVESLVKTKDYPVYGYNNGNHCDHQIKEFLGNANYNIMGRILNGQSGQPLCKINLNDICSLQITQEEIKFGGEFLVRDLNQAAANLRSFTFTDEDVQLMLMRKLMKESAAPGNFDGSRSKLIVAIQRTSHEIELLTELVKNDPSKLEHLRALEARRAKMEEQLQTMKAPTKTPIFVKNCAVLRVTDEQNSKGGVTRKTTQPTPMIIGSTQDNYDSISGEHRKRERRSIGDLSLAEQRQLVKAYMDHMQSWEPSMWERKNTKDNMGAHDNHIPGFPGMITWEDYQNTS